MHQNPFSAGDPAGGAYDAPPDPLVGWEAGYPLPIPHPPRRLDLGVPNFISRKLATLTLYKKNKNKNNEVYERRP